MRRLRIGVSCFPSVGGSGVVAIELGKALVQRGHTVHVIAHEVPFRLQTFDPCMMVHEVQPVMYDMFRYTPYDLLMAAKMAQVAKRYRLDVLHVHYAFPHALCAFLAKTMCDGALPVVTTLHGTDISLLAIDEGLADVIRLGIEQSDAVTAVSQHLIDETMERLAPKKHIHRIVNFVDTQVFYPRRCPKLRARIAPDGQPILLHVSNFRAIKRVHDVVETFALVRQAMPAKLLLAGEGPELNRIQCLVHARGVEADVLFVGKQNEVAELISMADVMLLPSEMESFGLVALEAMACGVPTVASDIGGLPEVVLDGVTGFLRPVGHIHAFADAVLQLLRDAPMYTAFRDAGIARAQTVFGGTAQVDAYEAVYASVCAEEA
jgi:N-acetyl-alpha-D-glucosaminyl L-malate synthase BshA